MKKNFNQFLDFYLSELVSSINKSKISQIEKASSKILETIKKKGTIFVCGNGGSAAISNHYVCDYLKFLRQHTNLMPKVISLSSNLETITAISNDIDYSQVFKYQAESLFQKNDLLIIISSSGNSKNVKEIVKFSKKKKVSIIGFSGFDGGYLKKNSDISIHIPAKNYGISEDSHHILMHIILQYLILKQQK
ncbi:SIS domain-containing protein [Candidatus Pelagibacter sp.]|uniref:SIS domain-containing protein n=1 Tax=Candidatus Pelagibacter sp. TaxID=2024849 RepID=UPI003F862F9B